MTHKVVVTGATGNVGTQVLRSLRESPEVGEIVGLARHRPAEPIEGVRFVEADVVKDDFVPLFEGAHAVIHLAWLIQPSRDALKLETVNVEGSRRVFEAAARAGVRKLIVASSVGAYGPGPKDRAVDEGWDTTGISSSLYSRQKAAVERLMDRVEHEHPEMIVTRMRPGFVLQRQAGPEIKRLFVGRWVPHQLFRPALIPFVPNIPELRVQVVHSRDLGDAFCRAVEREAPGAFNLAADPVIDPSVLGAVLDAKPIPIAAGTLRRLVAVSYRLRLHRTEPGWLDIAFNAPIMSSERARRELGWNPVYSSTDALLELFRGIRTQTGASTWPLRSREGRASAADETPATQG